MRLWSLENTTCRAINTASKGFVEGSLGNLAVLYKYEARFEAEWMYQQALRIFEGTSPSLILVAVAASFFIYVVPLAAELDTACEAGSFLLDAQDPGELDGSAPNGQHNLKSLPTEEHCKLIAEEQTDETAEMEKHRPIEASASDGFQQALWCKPWPICETPEEHFSR